MRHARFTISLSMPDTLFQDRIKEIRDMIHDAVLDELEGWNISMEMNEGVEVEKAEQYTTLLKEVIAKGK